jgi:hypothetical protein
MILQSTSDFCRRPHLHGGTQLGLAMLLLRIIIADIIVSSYK